MKPKFLEFTLLPWRRFFAAVTVLAGLSAGGVEAADTGPRHHA